MREEFGTGIAIAAGTLVVGARIWCRRGVWRSAAYVLAPAIPDVPFADGFDR